MNQDNGKERLHIPGVDTHVNANTKMCPILSGVMGVQRSNCVTDQCMGWRPAGIGGFCGMAGAPSDFVFMRMRSNAMD